MKLSRFIEGLKTLQPYYDNGDGHHIGAEHEQFYAYPTKRPLTPEDVQKMRDLGWHQEFEDEEENEKEDPEYDPEAVWTVYT